MISCTAYVVKVFWEVDELLNLAGLGPSVLLVSGVLQSVVRVLCRKEGVFDRE